MDMKNTFQTLLFCLLANKPTLYASKSSPNESASGSQGGTLPDQIFIHYSGSSLAAKMADPDFIDDTAWFFAHEAGHIYQSGVVATGSSLEQESWLHEGNAEMLASLALLALYPQLEGYLAKRHKSAKAHCVKGLKNFVLVEAAKNKQFGLYYTCGLLMHNAIDIAVKKSAKLKHGVISLWREYQKAIIQGKPASAQTFLAMVKTYASATLAERLSVMANQKLDNPDVFIEALNVD
ncbi:MAG: hypothetical protein ACI9FJ_002465 [Alteromonadaceae bacterium]|jgi:hypothetical protein